MDWKRSSPGRDRSGAVSPLYVDDAASIARAIVGSAVERVSARLGVDPQDVPEILQRGEELARGEFKLGLARRAAEFLGLYDEDVKAVYVYDHEGRSQGGGGEEPRRWQVHLIVWTEPKTAALKSLVSALDRALGGVLGESERGAGAEHCLDVQLVDNADIRSDAGYAALLSSPRFRPTRVWQREPAGASLPEAAFA